MRRETISAVRFGFGLSPSARPPVNASSMIDAAKRTSQTPPRITLQVRTKQITAYRASRKEDESTRKAAQRTLRQSVLDDVRHNLALAVSDSGFGERLVSFWGDHFSVSANGPALRVLVPDFIAQAIRPNITATFPKMLHAVAKHPAMLIYLNQVQSVGPNSPVGRRRNRGINENLAREILELHTLGADAAYTQSDVQAFAKLLTGLSVDRTGFRFRHGISEPGPHTVLGQAYGSVRVSLPEIQSALTDIALHPDTARHLSRKIIIHFIGVSDQRLEKRMAESYLGSQGDLTTLYATLLEDSRAWSPKFHKAKLPYEFIVSSLRAAGATAETVLNIEPAELRTGVLGALRLMGQPIFQPPGPDGWDELPENWITPPGLAARIRWAKAFANRIQSTHDPRDFLETTLADAASPILKASVAGSESRSEGLALTLVSPEFNRR